MYSVSENALPSRCITIRVYKPTNFSIVISAVDIVQTGFHIVVIDTVTERIYLTHCRSKTTCNGEDIAPCVVGIAYISKNHPAKKQGGKTLRICVTPCFLQMLFTVLIF